MNTELQNLVSPHSRGVQKMVETGLFEHHPLPPYLLSSGAAEWSDSLVAEKSLQTVWTRSVKSVSQRPLDKQDKCRENLILNEKILIFSFQESRCLFSISMIIFVDHRTYNHQPLYLPVVYILELSPK